jgi:hypothetical protein
MVADSKPAASVSKRGGRTKIADGSVRVWSEVGVTLPIFDAEGNSTYASLRFGFGHERICKSSSVVELDRTETLIDEFNEKVLEKRLQKYQRSTRRAVTQEDDEKPKKKKGKSVQERARKRREGK